MTLAILIEQEPFVRALGRAKSDWNNNLLPSKYWKRAALIVPNLRVRPQGQWHRHLFWGHSAEFGHFDQAAFKLSLAGI